MADLLISVPAIGIWIAVLTFFRVYRVWLPFYILGVVGLAAVIIYLGRSIIPLELWLKTYTGLNVYYIANAIGVPTELFEGVPGALLVLVISQQIGWTVVHIDIECSGLLETAALVGLLAFYPGWPIGKKAVLVMIGLAATYLANIIRILTIVAILHWGGKDTLFMTHTIIARGLFFGIVIFVYWYIFTQQTIRTIRENLRRGAAG
ncbi:MAG: archaeosortase/exosortase family protein [Chloroflexi bacterium]|nr:archaeosortase/exosortase family protein [Chloroflexota bacterium]